MTLDFPFRRKKQHSKTRTCVNAWKPRRYPFLITNPMGNGIAETKKQICWCHNRRAGKQETHHVCIEVVGVTLPVRPSREFRLYLALPKCLHDSESKAKAEPEEHLILLAGSSPASLFQYWAIATTSQAILAFLDHKSLQITLLTLYITHSFILILRSRRIFY